MKDVYVPTTVRTCVLINVHVHGNGPVETHLNRLVSAFNPVACPVYVNWPISIFCVQLFASATIVRAR